MNTPTDPPTDTTPTIPPGEWLKIREYSQPEDQFMEWLFIGALVAHEKATGTQLPNGGKGGMRISMQIDGVEVSPRLLVKQMKTHFDRRDRERDSEVRVAAARLLRGRVRQAVDTMEKVRDVLREELMELFRDQR